MFFIGKTHSQKYKKYFNRKTFCEKSIFMQCQRSSVTVPFWLRSRELPSSRR